MQIAWRPMALVLAGLYVVAGCGGSESIEFGPGDRAGAGTAADAHPDSTSSANGGTGGTTASGDSNVDVASESSLATPDVSTVDAVADGKDAAAPDVNTAAEADATSQVADDASGETLTEAEASDDAIADATDDAPPLSRICAPACVTTDDCRGDASTNKLICDPAGHRCVTCVDDVPCIAAASQWSKTCAVDGDCTAAFGDYCVDIGGFGYCAFGSTKIGTLSCSGNASTYTIKKHVGSETVGVCAKLTNTCDLRRGRCEGPCSITCVDGGSCTNTCTVLRGGKICNATTKRCECAADIDCAAPSSHCNLATLQCECSSGTDCATDGASVIVCK